MSLKMLVSFSVSNEFVDSSIIRTLVLLQNALAIFILCFCPVDIREPFPQLLYLNLQANHL